MRKEQHEEAYKEHLANINKAIEENIVANQRNLGFDISQGSIELFSLYLHQLNFLQTSGDQLDHRVFKSPALIAKKLPPDFPSKIKILDLMKNIEEERIALCYGNRKPKQRIEKAITYFNELRKIINKEINDAGTK